MSDLFVVICREHGVLEVGAPTRYAADQVIDDHAESCSERVVRLTEDRWEELKKAGLLRDEITGSAPATAGP